MRISDWSSDVCSSDLELFGEGVVDPFLHQDAVGTDAGLAGVAELGDHGTLDGGIEVGVVEHQEGRVATELQRDLLHRGGALLHQQLADLRRADEGELAHDRAGGHLAADRSEEHTSELQSLMRISSAVFCLTKKT